MTLPAGGRGRLGRVRLVSSCGQGSLTWGLPVWTQEMVNQKQEVAIVSDADEAAPAEHLLISE